MLNQGDTIGIIALSGNCDREKVISSKEFFESLGYKVKLSKNIFDENRYLAGNDNDKIDELHNFFKDSEIKLILCARGGYGAIRLVNDIDYEIIKENPKPFCGFSDVTALLLMIYKNTGMITYHSPMACSDFTKEVVSEFTLNSFLNIVNNKYEELLSQKVYKRGTAKGILWGGNLTTTASLCGQDFIPEEDFIFFAEDINESVYKIDRMFHQLFNINRFRQFCKGIVLGDFLGIDNQEWLGELFAELGEQYNIPITGGYKITHAEEKITIPIGVKVFMDADVLSFVKNNE